ncbi:hypothetical protein MP619_00855 [Streptococcus dysgalactiae]|uniref:Uncharacterized protein n=1 Tax=Streptococcus dysgalactiae TaxID=1334 RepID=A0AAF0A1L5_STRDY|nr:hypothetical protein [Streptococcus dysgalactiae]QGH05102.1 hypothetical protein EA458_12010 [Streptococcus dysgalactiae subsp. dysgalactiae]WAI93203.1 hypothetical protein MP619_00855 [Streptococcus dysgalactiae]WCE86302.1 hypothetical protein PMN45_01585 [Streptococcus dysgalactiae]WCN26296.1 hypothetical protein PP188_01590 [Streptococcus dysgalactiae]
MKQNKKYYVSGQLDSINGVFDVGIEVTEENAFMAAIKAFKDMEDYFDDVTILGVKEVQDGDY